jgi:hypothetical protein
MPERSPDAAATQHPVLVVGLGCLGFGAGVGLLLAGGNRTVDSTNFIATDGFRVWAAVIGIQTAFWAIVVGPLWVELARVWRRTTMGRASMLVLAGVLGLVVVALPFASTAGRIGWPLWGHQVKTTVLTIVGGVLVGVPALSGIGLVQERIRVRDAQPVTDADVPMALEARAELLRFLGIAGAVIGLAVLAAGALHRASVPIFVKETDFTQDAILLYGAFFTGLLSLVYAPAYLVLKRFDLRIRDHYFSAARMPSPNEVSFEDWLDKRAKLESILRLDDTPMRQLQTSLFILAPLLSAVIPALLPTLG